MRSNKVIIAVVSLFAVFGLVFGASTATAKNSPKEQARQGLQKALPYGMPAEAKKVVLDTMSAVDSTPLSMNGYVTAYRDAFTGQVVSVAFVYNPTDDDPYRWTECFDCGVIKTKWSKNKQYLVAAPTAAETIVYGFTGYSKGECYLNTPWDGSATPFKSTLKWMGSRQVMDVQYVTIGIYSNNYPTPEYYYPGEK